jgi:hypothetical protein
MLCGKFNKFEPISPQIFRVKSARSWEVIVIDDSHAPDPERFVQFVQMGNGKGWAAFLAA